MLLESCIIVAMKQLWNFKLLSVCLLSLILTLGDEMSMATPQTSV